MDINLGQAQNKFSLFFEKIVNNNSAPDLINNSNLSDIKQQSLQKIYDNLDSIVFSLKKTSENQNEVNTYLNQLAEQIKKVNNHSADLEEKLSNFLSTQLNTQSSILQLINKINEQGILNVGGKKRDIYKFSKMYNKKIRPIPISKVKNFPKDSSINIDKLKKILKKQNLKIDGHNYNSYL